MKMALEGKIAVIPGGLQESASPSLSGMFRRGRLLLSADEI